MVLAVDIGNTITEIGFFGDGELLFTERRSSDPAATDFEYAVFIRNALELHGMDIGRSSVEGAIISSVVPDVTPVFAGAIKKLFSVNAKVVGPGIKTGLHIRIDDPAQLGSDLAAQAVAASEYYPLPAAIIDFGTSTTIGIIDKDGCYIGGFLSPGVAVSADALARKASQLPRVSFDKPKKFIGTNTVACLKSGILYGTASMVDGLLDRAEELLGCSFSCVATGALAPLITGLCKRDIKVDKHLLMKGLMIIYSKN